MKITVWVRLVHNWEVSLSIDICTVVYILGSTVCITIGNLAVFHIGVCFILYSICVFLITVLGRPWW